MPAIFGEELAESLLLKVGFGESDILGAAEHAATAIRSAPSGCEVHHILAGLASCARHRGHQEERLETLMKDWQFGAHVPDLYSFPCEFLQDHRVVQREMHVLLPHEVFGSMVATSPEVAEELFGSATDRRVFWEGMQHVCETGPGWDPERQPGATAHARRLQFHRDWLFDHPARPCESVDSMESCVPIGMHGDAGGAHGKDKVTIVTWGSLAVRGPTLDTRILAAAVRESTSVKSSGSNLTLFAVFQVMAWSLKALCDGHYPTCDHAGRPWAPGTRRALLSGTELVRRTPRRLTAAWCELRGDWEFLKNGLALQESYATASVCHLCAAQRTAAPHYGALSMARVLQRDVLRDTLRSNADFMAAAGARWPRSPLLDIPGFNIWRCVFDCMHTLELGILQRAVPCALQELCGAGLTPTSIEAARGGDPGQRVHVFEGRNVEARVRRASESYRDWARSSVPAHSRVRNITKAWVEGPKPHITQAHAKAAALRAMLPWVLLQCSELVDASDYAAARACFFREVCALEDVWQRAGRFMTVNEEQAAARHGEAALACLFVLSQCHERWHIVPKVHALAHLVYDSARVNPRYAHCYQDEDMVGRMKKVYKQCHATTAERRALQRYGVALAVTALRRMRLARGLIERLPAPVTIRYVKTKWRRGKRLRFNATAFR